MNLDKYFETNIIKFNHDLTNMFKMYDSKLKEYINKDSKILDIWPWNWGFSYHITKRFWVSIKNINFLDISSWVIENLKNTKELTWANFILSDLINFLENNIKKFDIIIMRHVIEHFTKENINKIIPLLEKNISENGVIFMETPNVASPLWQYMFFQDYSHYSPFVANSLKECINWNSENLNIKIYNSFYSPFYFRTIKNFIIFSIWFFVEVISSMMAFYTILYKNKIFSPRMFAIIKYNKK